MNTNKAHNLRELNMIGTIEGLSEQLNAAEALIKQLQEKYAWHDDIDKAPNNTPVLVMLKDVRRKEHRIQVGYWNWTGSKTKLWVVGNYFARDFGTPYKWAYIPEE